jgi:hypothetical protein
VCSILDGRHWWDRAFVPNRTSRSTLVVFALLRLLSTRRCITDETSTLTDGRSVPTMRLSRSWERAPTTRITTSFARNMKRLTAIAMPQLTVDDHQGALTTDCPCDLPDCSLWIDEIAADFVPRRTRRPSPYSGWIAKRDHLHRHYRDHGTPLLAIWRCSWARSRGYRRRRAWTAPASLAPCVEHRPRGCPPSRSGDDGHAESFLVTGGPGGTGTLVPPAGDT